MEPIKTEEYKGYTIEIYQDEDPESPREWDNIGKMYCFHKRYRLGDSHDYPSSEFISWEEFRERLEDEFNIAVILPLYLYDHSGVTMNTKGFSCGWDSEQVGWIFVEEEVVEEEYEDDPKALEKAEAYLLGEVKDYDDYLTGSVYGYVIEKIDESCWGFYGLDYCREEARQAIDWQVKEDQKLRAEMTRVEVGEEVRV